MEANTRPFMVTFDKKQHPKSCFVMAANEANAVVEAIAQTAAKNFDTVEVYPLFHNRYGIQKPGEWDLRIVDRMDSPGYFEGEDKADLFLFTDAVIYLSEWINLITVDGETHDLADFCAEHDYDHDELVEAFQLWRYTSVVLCGYDYDTED